MYQMAPDEDVVTLDEARMEVCFVLQSTMPDDSTAPLDGAPVEDLGK